MKLPEKIVAHDARPKERRLLKKIWNRAVRRLARRDPEGAPTEHFYRGWTL